MTGSTRDLYRHAFRLSTTASSELVKAEYAAAKRGFADRGAPLRARLVRRCDRLLAALDDR